MEVFVRVVENRSFSAAARQLRMGQPSVSKAVQGLENRLGVRLLLRSTHGLTPTEAGLAFYERARRALDEAGEADTAARGLGAGLTGRLRVSTTITFARLHLIPHLAEFLERHPALEVDVVMDDSSVNLVEEGIDLALRMGALPDSTLTARRIGQCQRLVLGTPAYFARAGEPRTPADLAGHQVMVLGQPGLGGTWGADWAFRKDGAETAVTVGGRVRFNVGEGVREAVLAGLGLAVGSEWLFAPELASGSVKTVMADWELPPLDLWAVFPTAGRQTTPKARLFAAFVEARLAAAAGTCPAATTGPHMPDD